MIEDSPRNCARCGKRMFIDLGQHDAEGSLEVWHECWSCDYREPESFKPRLVLVGPSVARAGEAG